LLLPAVGLLARRSSRFATLPLPGDVDAALPAATFPPPSALFPRASWPMATLLPPVVLLSAGRHLTAVFELPVVLA